MPFRFLLVDREGADLGVHEFAVETWAPGDLLPLAAGRYLRVVGVDYNPEGSELSGTLEVEQVGD